MAREHYDVSGKVVLVTGAARGIGAATAKRLHARGAHVALVGLEPEELERRVDELGPGRAAWFEADVTDDDALRAAVDGVVERFGGIDVAIANAGLSFVGTVETQPMQEWLRTIDVNLVGVYRTNRAVLPHVVARNGYVLNVSSLSAIAHAPLMSAYTASKAGCEAMTDALRIELSTTGATAGCAYFGFIDTDLVRGSFDHPAAAAARSAQPAFVRTPIKLDKAVDAIERGVTRRAARLWAPWWVGLALPLRGILAPLIEKGSVRERRSLAEAIRLADPATGAAPPYDPKLGASAVGAAKSGD